MKKRIALILCVSLLVLASTSEEQKNLPTSSNTGFNLESIHLNHDSFLEIIGIITEEAETSITKSFAEGYKAGVLEYAPQAEFWKTNFEQASVELQTLQKQKQLPVWAVPVTFSLSFALGVITTLALR